MNSISLRTSKGEYRGGDIVYGAVYVSILKPLFADHLVLVVEGCEKCSWCRNRHNPRPDAIDGEPKEAAVPIQESFEGAKKFLYGNYRLAVFEDGAVPLGSYAYPFQVPLKLELPNSFQRRDFVDDVKETSYQCSVSYTLCAKFVTSGKDSHSLSVYQPFSIITDLSAKRESFKTNYPKKKIEAQIDVCCCFTQGVLNLEAEIDRFTYRIGSTILVKYKIHNVSSSVIKQCVITLARIIKLVGKASEQEDDSSGVVNGFYETVHQVVDDFQLAKDDSLTREVFIPLDFGGSDQLSSTTGDLVKCLYQLEVDVKVPWDVDASLELPVTVNVGSNQEWLNWRPPGWTRELIIKKTLGVTAVPDRILLNNTFSNVPLPIRGDGL